MKKYLIFGFRYYGGNDTVDSVFLGSRDSLKDVVKFVEKHFDSDDAKDTYSIRNRDTWENHDELVKEFKGCGS